MDPAVERVMMSRTLFFENPLGDKISAYLLGTASLIDTSRVWELEEILKSVFTWE